MLIDKKSGPRILIAAGIIVCLATGLLTNEGRADDEIILSNLGMLQRLAKDAVSEAVDQLDLPAGGGVTVLSSVPHEGNEFVQAILAQTLIERGHQVRIATVAYPEPGEDDDDDAPNTPAVGAGGRVNAGGRPGGPAGGPGAGAPGGAAQPDSALVEDPGGMGAVPTEAAPEVMEAPSGLEVRPSLDLPPGDVLDLRLLEFGVNYKEADRSWLIGSVQFTRVAGAYLQIAHLEGSSGDLEKVVTAERHLWDRISGRQKVLAEGASYPFTAPELHAPKLGQYVEPAVVVGIVSTLIYLFYTNQN